ncbi:MAG: sensor domain-containing phosphodiesterase [Woeseiaceae bacterium]|nr:sensor domain-containing phosphodiesterase [Woeseiaceae bacterium]
MTAIVERVRDVVGALRMRTPGKRVLVHEILSIQILSATIVGTLAIAALYWGGQWVLQDNYSRWALQWTAELNELGSPLYLSDDSEALIRLESFVERYPEIDRVAYYDRDGSSLYSVDNDADIAPLKNLSDDVLEEASAAIGSDEPYLLSGSVIDPRQFEILAPVWTEAIADDGLFDFDPTAPERNATTELVGFVGIHLDFVLFHDRLLTNIRAAIMVLVVLLVLFALYGRWTLQKALRSISELERPIRELAKGNLDVKFQPAEHREISDIVEALETTATALSERDAELLELANHDSLTGLFNRRRFVEELRLDLTRIMNKGGTSALFFIDLDQFKYVNDLCGHPAGDRLIRKVADELSRSIPENAIVARFGGDEFAVLLRAANEVDARDSAELILTNMRRMAHIENEHVFHVHCSIGVAIASGINLHADELIAQADIACREAKSAGRNRVRFFDFDDTGESRVDKEVGWMNRLRSALDEDGFELRFQPINEIRSGQTTHHEVLIRARAEDGQLVSPDAFLPAAVRFGLMTEIDLWMIRHAAMAYAEHVTEHPDLHFSINISANAFESENLPRYVRKTFNEFGVPPKNVILEITESLAIRRPVHVERQIAALRAMGCKLALDDFGTGYSSFSYLQKIDCDYLKIDGAFVVGLLDSPVDQKVIRLIADIGREAGMKVIAEYVQNAESLALLEELGVDMAQGYFVGRPSRVPRFAPTPISLRSRYAARTSGKSA